ncbi:MAG: penicillin acylase family protein [Acidobacteriia bacterium]|nr:penicillin acylase family protein [Terriglobia bacterium]
MRTCLLAFVLAASAASAAAKTEILWDRYGVAHIFAADRESMFYAEGWAQAQAQGNLLLRLYGESRGRAAEYWGASHLALDRWLQLNGVPERAKTWYEAQDPEFRKYLDAFARGINDYAQAHPDSIAPESRVVLPVSGLDVVEHTLRAVHYMYMGSMERAERESKAYLKGRPVSQIWREDPDAVPGSNTWTIGPSHSASGNAMLIINPHLNWGDTFYRYMEVHLVGPGYDLYGAPQIGFPTPVVGFNPHAGWGRTVNTIDTVDFYALKVKGGQYEFDGALRDFERQTKTLKIKQADGSFKEERLEIRRSVQGPVVFDQQGATIAMRVAGLDRPKMLEQWFRMGEATNLDQFKDALRMGCVPMWNANYADAQGHIMLVFNGLVPRRKTGDQAYWAGVVPGDTSKTMWDGYLSFDELPKSIDPKAGFNQNTNEPPWWTTLPPLDASKYPPYVAPLKMGNTLFRTKRSLHMITEQPKISYETLLANKLSTRVELADAVLPDLFKAAEGSSDPAVKEAAAVLAQWDRATDINSRGAVLFRIFADQYFGTNGDIDERLRVKFDPAYPVQSAYGLADSARALEALAKAAAECRKTYGSLDVQWGQVNRFAAGTADVPGDGGPGRLGVFRTITYSKKVGDRYYAASGETFVCAIEFAAAQRAQCALSYGNSSQPGSVHQEDQLPLMMEKRLHPVWRERAEIERNLEKRETF